MKVFGVLLFAALAGCGGRGSEAAQVPQAPAGQAWLSPQQIKDAQIGVQPVGVQAVGGAVVTSGKVTFDDLRVSHVFSPVSGRVTQILAQPGQRVKKDQPLAVIQSPDVGTAYSDLAKAHAELDAAEKDFKRQKELFEAHAAAQKDFEAAKANFDKTRAELDRAQRKARLLGRGGADSVTQEFQLRAQIDGEVVVRNLNIGTEVQGTYGGGQAVELFTIGELDRVWVLADVFEMDLGQVKTGAHVTVKVVAYPNKIFEGVVEYVSGSLDPNSRTAKVKISVDNKERMLKPEMYATVSIAVGTRKALAIPRTALLRLGDQTVVFVQVGQTPDGKLKFERRPVHVDEEEGGDYLPVTHGLSDGDPVVTTGGILLLGML
jgi:cobalt-zinc-cadmium efflux system membrane fusion protein